MDNLAEIVYVIDDDASVRKSLGRLLQTAGYKVRAFASAEEFLDIQRHPSLVCLVLDVRLPGMTGLELQKQLIKCGCRTPIILMSAHYEEEMAQEATRCGAAAFLKKPFDDDVLRCALEKVQREREYQE